MLKSFKSGGFDRSVASNPAWASPAASCFSFSLDGVDSIKRQFVPAFSFFEISSKKFSGQVISPFVFKACAMIQVWFKPAQRDSQHHHHHNHNQPPPPPPPEEEEDRTKNMLLSSLYSLNLQDNFVYQCVYT